MIKKLCQFWRIQMKDNAKSDPMSPSKPFSALSVYTSAPKYPVWYFTVCSRTCGLGAPCKQWLRHRAPCSPPDGLSAKNWLLGQSRRGHSAGSQGSPGGQGGRQQPLKPGESWATGVRQGQLLVQLLLPWSVQPGRPGPSHAGDHLLGLR